MASRYLSRQALAVRPTIRATTMICGDCWIWENQPFCTAESHEIVQKSYKNHEKQEIYYQNCLLLGPDVDNDLHGAAQSGSQTEIKRMTNPANIQAVQAKQLKNGKYQYIAILADGTEEVIKKAGTLKPFVNVYDRYVNGNGKANALSSRCTYNSKPDVKQLYLKISPIKSIEVEVI